MWLFQFLEAARNSIGASVIGYNWDDIVLMWKGKKIVVLGPRASGKTTFINFLRTGSIPTSYKQTTSTEIKKGGTRQIIADVEINILETEDVSGSDDAYSEWKRVYQSAKDDGYIFYMLRGDLLFSGDLDYENRVKRDMGHIGEWKSNDKTGLLLFIIATHCDLIKEFAKLPRGKRAEFDDRFRKLDSVKRLIELGGGNKYVRVMPATLCKQQDREGLVCTIFSQGHKT